MSLFGFNKKRELSNYKLTLIITHVPTGFKVEFPAFLDMFSDAFTQQWNSEDVYGRMDPIATFINTRRAISLAWNVPAQSYYDAQSNLQKVNTLMSFMYPLYANHRSTGATAINQAPLLRIKFGNLVEDAQTGDGLLGYVNGFTFDPDLTQGMFYQEGTGRGNSSIGAQYYPKTFRLNAELNVLHEHSLGYTRGSDGKSFVYAGAGITDATYPYASNLNAQVKYDEVIGESFAKPDAPRKTLVATEGPYNMTYNSDRYEVESKGPYSMTFDPDRYEVDRNGPYNMTFDPDAPVPGVQPGVKINASTEAQANPESPQNVISVPEINKGPTP
jgi:hypothetical protein